MGKRVNSRIPIAIRWSEDGRPFTIEAKTVDTSSSGCLAITSQGIVIGQAVQLINLINGNECDARVVRHNQQVDSTWELGIQLDAPSDEFWGLEF